MIWIIIAYLLLIGFLAALLCFSLTYIVKQHLLKKQVLDVPNERSNHSTPTPRGGGIAVVLTFSAFYLFFYTFPYLGMLFSPVLFVGLLALALLSWAEDRIGIPAAVRLGLQLLIIAVVSIQEDIKILDNGLIPAWLNYAITIIVWGWFINLYNFMDGIDGITGVETSTVLLGVLIIFFFVSEMHNYTPSLVILIGCCLGFMKHNWHPASIFLGDIGSITLGYMVGFFLLTLSAIPDGAIPALILPLYYLLDSGITITKRALNKEKIWQPHSKHFYQKAVRAGASHSFVAKRILWLNSFLIALALFAFFIPDIAWLCLVVAVLQTLYLLQRLAKYGS